MSPVVYRLEVLSDTDYVPDYRKNAQHFLRLQAVSIRKSSVKEIPHYEKANELFHERHLHSA